MRVMGAVGRTVADLTTEEREAYRQALRRREADRLDAVRRLAERAWAVAREAARILKEEYGARQVILFGSLARGTFGLRSDVDLAVEGLSGRAFYRAVGRLQALDSSLSVDLVDVEEASPALRRAIEREGIPL